MGILHLVGRRVAPWTDLRKLPRSCLQRGKAMEPGPRPTTVVGRLPGGPHQPPLALAGRHVSPNHCSTCLDLWYVGLVLHVGPLIHVSLNSALWLVDGFSRGSQGPHTLHFSPIFHLCIFSRGIVDFYFILDKNAYESFKLQRFSDQIDAWNWLFASVNSLSPNLYHSKQIHICHRMPSKLLLCYYNSCNLHGWNQ